MFMRFREWRGGCDEEDNDNDDDDEGKMRMMQRWRGGVGGLHARRQSVPTEPPTVGSGKETRRKNLRNFDPKEIPTEYYLSINDFVQQFRQRGGGASCWIQFFLQMNQVSLFQRGRSDSKVECITFFRCNVHSWGRSNYEQWRWRWWWQEEGERGCQQWYGNYHSRPNIRECLPKALQSFTLTIVRLIVIAFARGFDSLNHVSHSKQFFNEFVTFLYSFLSFDKFSVNWHNVH